MRTQYFKVDCICSNEIRESVINLSKKNYFLKVKFKQNILNLIFDIYPVNIEFPGAKTILDVEYNLPTLQVVGRINDIKQYERLKKNTTINHMT